MTREKILNQAKPILFNTEMVKAILEGRKTVTRRVVKPKHKGASGIRNMGGAIYDVIPVDFIDGETTIREYQKPPYAAGDYLYVRETWAKQEIGYSYKADWPDMDFIKKWKPSIHMPKEAARIFLKVTDVRVERLQDIMKSPHGPNNQVVREGCTYGCDFIAVWESTIKKSEKDTYGWDANPWVWVIEFERVEV